MANWIRKKTSLIKKTPTAILASAAVHIVFIAVAITWIVIEATDSGHGGFKQVKIMERKPKKTTLRRFSKQKQSTTPNTQITPIISDTPAEMDDYSLPAMNLSESSDLGKINLNELVAPPANNFGYDNLVANSFEGTFYDLKRLRSGVPNPAISARGDNREGMRKVINEFVKNNWSPSVFSKYYRAPHRLYATQFMVPPCASSSGPPKFGITDPGFVANFWVIHYTGEIGHPTGGRFRFWGLADDVLIVRVDGKWVFDGSWGPDHENVKGFVYEDKREHRKHSLGNAVARVGNWFELKPGHPVEMDLLVSEIPGGTFSMMLLIEQEGVEYPVNEYGAPILPMFKTREVPRHLVEEIKYASVPERFDIEGGPVFSAF